MTYQLIKASAHQTGLPDESVHMIATSPPYWGLRVYNGDQAIGWPEVEYSPMPGLPMLTIPAMRCGLGEENTPESFVGHLILIMREQYRILRKDGTCFVNLGDSYNGSGGAGGDYGVGGIKEGQPKFPGRKVGTLKNKDLCMIPARFALAAQADGWYVRSVMPWLKRNGMPDSCTDRPSQVIENVFLLAKSQNYFFDMEAVKMPVAEASIGRADRKKNLIDRTGQGSLGKQIENGVDGTHSYAGLALGRNGKTGYDIEGGRNFRSSDLFFKTWQGLVSSDDGDPLAMVVNTSGYSAAHFACWPPALVEIMIKAGSSAHGVCVKCKAPWQRVVERDGGNWEARKEAGAPMRYGMNNNKGEAITNYGGSTSTTTGWQPTCACNCDEVEPAVICDPFSGSGTTGKVALQLGRSYIGIDVCNEYLTELAPARMSNLQIEMAW